VPCCVSFSTIIASLKSIVSIFVLSVPCSKSLLPRFLCCHCLAWVCASSVSPRSLPPLRVCSISFCTVTASLECVLPQFLCGHCLVWVCASSVFLWSLPRLSVCFFSFSAVTASLECALPQFLYGHCLAWVCAPWVSVLSLPRLSVRFLSFCIVTASLERALPQFLYCHCFAWVCSSSVSVLSLLRSVPLLSHFSLARSPGCGLTEHKTRFSVAVLIKVQNILNCLEPFIYT
jgi:hypothetical protein